MAPEDQRQRARDLYSQLKAEDDYPHWNESDIFDMIAQDMEDEHIACEWREAVRVYRDARDGAAGILSRLSRFNVDRPSVSLQDIEGWMAQDISEDVIALEYLRSTSAPSLEDAELCLAELRRLLLPCFSLAKEDILQKLIKGCTGEQLCFDYMAWQRVEQLGMESLVPFEHVFDIAESNLRLNSKGPDDVLDDILWFELHFGLLYATTHLPSEPIVMRHVVRSLYQYDAYFDYEWDTDSTVFNAMTVKLAMTTIGKLNRQLVQRIKDGGHLKALNTQITPEMLQAYRNIRARVGGNLLDLDVEAHSEIWQFLMILAAKLHPHLTVPYNKAPTPIKRKEKTKPSGGIPNAWAHDERYALWRCINRWCKKNGVDKFLLKNITMDMCSGFTEDITVECARKNLVSNRTTSAIVSQIRDAVRRDRAVANRPIHQLGVHATNMEMEIESGKVIPDSVRFPHEAIPMAGVP